MHAEKIEKWLGRNVCRLIACNTDAGLALRCSNFRTIPHYLVCFYPGSVDGF